MSRAHSFTFFSLPLSFPHKGLTLLLPPPSSLPPPRLGIEGLVTFKSDQHTFDPEKYCITLPATSAPGAKPVTIAVFDKVVVNIAVEKDRNTQRGKVKMTLVEPVESSGL